MIKIINILGAIVLASVLTACATGNSTTVRDIAGEWTLTVRDDEHCGGKTSPYSVPVSVTQNDGVITLSMGSAPDTVEVLGTLYDRRLTLSGSHIEDNGTTEEILIGRTDRNLFPSSIRGKSYWIYHAGQRDQCAGRSSFRAQKS